MLAADGTERWRGETRAAFRFFVLYFGLYVLATQMAGSLGLAFVGRILDPLVTAVGAHVFDASLTRAVTGSGDTLFDWVQAFTILLIATQGAIVWSVVDWRRPAYPRLNRWFRVFLRFALGATLVGYGMVKVIPMQMPAPSLMRLLEPFGRFSPMGVLWASIGASLPYERFAGSVELAAGVLLFVPRTATLGAMLALAATTQVFVLNMTYDVPVKLFSFHLIAMSAFLLAPQARVLAMAMFAVGARSRWAAAAQIVAGVFLVGMSWYGATTNWAQSVGAPKPALYGIWAIDVLQVDGQEPARYLGDISRWRDVVIDSPSAIVFVQADDTPRYYGAGYDMEHRTIHVAHAPGAASLQFLQPDSEHLTLDGSLNGHVVHLETTRVNLGALPLFSRGFHWIQEIPVNR